MMSSLSPDVIVNTFDVVPAISLNNRFSEAEIPQNRNLAPNNWNSAHQDSFCSESVGLSGPTGSRLKVTCMPNEYGTTSVMASNNEDNLVGVSFDFDTASSEVNKLIFTLIVFNEDCEILASVNTAGSDKSRSSGRSGALSFGGGYFYLNQNNDAIVATSKTIKYFKTSEIEVGSEISMKWESEDIVALVTKSTGKKRARDEGPNKLYCCMPIWHIKNAYWCLLSGSFDATSGKVTSNAYIAAVKIEDGVTKWCHSRELSNEWANNSIAVDQAGVYLVTNGGQEGGGHLWAFASDGTDNGKISKRWKSEYKNCGYQKPGQENNGSGTTPTIFDDGKLVAITDNDDPQLNVVVYSTEDGQNLLEVPVFPKKRSSNEASLIGVNKYIVVENNFGHLNNYKSPQLVSNEPGLAMIKVLNGPEDIAQSLTFEVIWEDKINTVFGMSMLARKSGIIYAYRGDWSGEKSATDGPMYYIHAIDSWDGRVIWRLPVGRGKDFRHDYGGIYFNKDGDRIYVGTHKYIICVQNVIKPV